MLHLIAVAPSWTPSERREAISLAEFLRIYTVFHTVCCTSLKKSCSQMSFGNFVGGIATELMRLVRPSQIY